MHVFVFHVQNVMRLNSTEWLGKSDRIDYLHICVCTLCIRMSGCLCVRLLVLYVYLCVCVRTSVYLYVIFLTEYVRTYLMCLSVCQTLPPCWSAQPLKTHLTMSCLSVCYREGWNDQFRAQRLPLSDWDRQVCCILSHETWWPRLLDVSVRDLLNWVRTYVPHVSVSVSVGHAAKSFHYAGLPGHSRPSWPCLVCLSVCLQAHCLLPGEMYKGVYCLPEIVTTAAMDFKVPEQRKWAMQGRARCGVVWCEGEVWGAEGVVCGCAKWHVRCEV